MPSDLPTTMRALLAPVPGDAERLVVDVVPVPPMGTGDVLVRVAAAGYTPDELDWPSTSADRLGRSRLPAIPSHEVSGTVAALGFGVGQFAVGDEVYGLTDWYRDGAAADYVAVEARNLAPKPRSVDHAAAATLPLAGLTAWQGLFTYGRLGAGQTVVIHGAGGGVGALAVQLARSAGAHVIGTGRAHVRELAHRLGADTFVDLDVDALPELPLGVLVFDTVGGDVLERSSAAVAEGTIVSIVEPPAVAPGTRGVFFVVEPDRAGLTELTRRVEAGDVTPVVGQACTLDEAPGVVLRKERHEIAGKVVMLASEAADATGLGNPS